MPLYLIHFDQPFSHARHYLGFVEDIEGLPARLERHRSGGGSKLMAAVTQAGIGWRLARLWPCGSRDDERRLKKRRDHPSLCPHCRAKRARRQSASARTRAAARRKGALRSCDRLRTGVAKGEGRG